MRTTEVAKWEPSFLCEGTIAKLLALERRRTTQNRHGMATLLCVHHKRPAISLIQHAHYLEPACKKSQSE